MRLRGYVTDAQSTYSDTTPSPDAQAEAVVRHIVMHPSFTLAHGDDEANPVDVEESPPRDWHKSGTVCPILDAISDGDAEGLVVYSLGALGLSTLGILRLINQVAKLGGHIVSVADGLDSTTPTGLTTVRTLYNLSLCNPGKLRRKGTLSERPKKSRYVPFGWRLGRTSGPWERRKGQPDMPPVRNPSEQVLLQEILENCDGTGAAAYALAKRLNGEGRRHPRLKKPWRAGNILAIYQTASKYQQDALMAMGHASMAGTG